MHKEILSHPDAETTPYAQIQEIKDGFIAHKDRLGLYAAHLCRNR